MGVGVGDGMVVALVVKSGGGGHRGSPCGSPCLCHL